tara:strand:- start:44 stop:520 length:477 start_codon:yes stop_codon:yes gene_type:complete
MKNFSFLLLLSLFFVSCDFSQKQRDQWAKHCNESYYLKNIENGEIKEKEILKCIHQLKEDGFKGTFIVDEDSLQYGWHEGVLSNPDDIIKVLKSNGFYAIFHRKGWSYFKKGRGFIDDSCGLMYLSDGFEFPLGVESSQFLINSSSGAGKWYYVEAKL